MSEEGADESAMAPEADAVREIRSKIFPFDPTLESLVALINLIDGPSIGVTLHIKGSIVSGMLISSRLFFKMLVTDIGESAERAEGNDADLARSFADFFRPSLESTTEALAEYDSSKKLPPRPHHIHLRHAQTLMAGTEPFTQSVWRGRLTAIDGWSIGNFGSIPPLPEKYF